jgi:hypothetical protein
MSKNRDTTETIAITEDGQNPELFQYKGVAVGDMSTFHPGMTIDREDEEK